MYLEDDRTGMTNVQIRLESSLKDHRIVLRAKREILQDQVVQFPPIAIQNKQITLLDNPDIKPNVQFIFTQENRLILKAIKPLKIGEQLIFRVNSFIVHFTQVEVKDNIKRMMARPINFDKLGLKKEKYPSLEEIRQKLGNPEPNAKMVPIVKNKIFQFGIVSIKSIQQNTILSVEPKIKQEIQYCDD